MVDYRAWETSVDAEKKSGTRQGITHVIYFNYNGSSWPPFTKHGPFCQTWPPSRILSGTYNQVPSRLVFYQMENMKHLNMWFPIAIKFVGARTKYVQLSHMQSASTSLFQNSKYSNKMVVKLLFRNKEKPSTYDEIRPVESCATRKAQVCFRIRNMQTMVVKLLFRNKEKPSDYDEILPCN